ncbi:MAG TPA: hypothetical protein VFM93_03820, partial [Candidatus Limnocylindria bacterium]|nr:hypothetical protein [Candidatus Limnocylindria bacterium]
FTRLLFEGMGDPCENHSMNDPVVVFDSLADRWVLSGMASIPDGPNYDLCVAVSKTSDPTGGYHRYRFHYPNTLDYPKLGVWPDAYYLSFIDGNRGGPDLCALDRAAMLEGRPATQQCFHRAADVRDGYSATVVLPADLDGPKPPPPGTPGVFVGVEEAAPWASGLPAWSLTALLVWSVHVDWADPSRSRISGPTSIPLPPTYPGCVVGGPSSCVPQPATDTLLSSQWGYLLNRLAYWNFGSHQSLVVTHGAVPDAGEGSGVRWYELRFSGGVPFLYQHGTYAPDARYRWTSSAAMNGHGDLAIGYSVSSSSMFPSIGVSGRLTDDPLGEMTFPEAIVLEGGASQIGSHRWGDYTSMSVDPVDDCTFWYVNQYYAAGDVLPRTRIAAFRLSDCAAAANDFSVTLDPRALVVDRGAAATATVRTAVLSGESEPLTLVIECADRGLSAQFLPASISSGDSAQLTLTASGSATASSMCMLRATGSAATRDASLDVTIRGSGMPPSPPPPPPPLRRTSGGCSSTGADAAAAVLSLIALAAARGRRSARSSRDPRRGPAGG